LQDEAVADVQVLTGARVVLRRPVVKDAEVMFAELASDPAVTRYLSWRPHRDVDETRRVITEQFNRRGETVWLIELRDTHELVGTCGWTRPQPHSVEFGYCLCRKWWGRGLASEVAGMLVEAASREPAVYRISAYCHVDNAASAAVLRHSGLNFEGRLARYVIFPNVGLEPQDCLMFGKRVR